MQSAMQLAIEEKVHHAERVMALISWGAGAALAIAVAWQLGHLGNRNGTWAAKASFVDWSVDGTADPVEVNGTLVMPEDHVMTHRPPAAGAAEMQKP
jgi:hypothetical protein